MFPESIKNEVVGLDTETSGLTVRDYCFGVSLAVRNESYYWDIRRHPQTIGWLNDHLATARAIVAHNASFDYRMLSAAGYNRGQIERWDDSCIRACLIDEHRQDYTLDDLALEYLGRRKIDIWPRLAELFGGRATKNVQISNLVDAPPELVAEYAKPDAELCLALWHEQERIIERDGLRDICDFERRLMRYVIALEARGIRVDIDAAERAQREITPVIEQKQQELEDLVGPINVNSSPQVKAMYKIEEQNDEYYVMGIRLEKTKKGNPSLGKNTLQLLADKDIRAALILEIRSLLKTRDTFLGGHILGSAFNGRVYPSIHQNKNEAGGTGTGRLAYTSPALQQIPTRNRKIAAMIKPIFLPEEGHVWVDADCDGFEVRTFAHLVNNPALIAAYHADPHMDLHQYVADLTGLPRSPVYEIKGCAKVLNLSAIFNRGNGAIAEEMGFETTWETFVPRGQTRPIRFKKAPPEAMAIINRYHQKVPGIRELAKRASAVAKARGYLRTYLGRHLHIERDKLYKASGILIQATAADKNKENIMKIEDTLEHGHLLLNTHDSYGMSISEEHAEKEWKRVQEVVQDAGFRVPIILKLNGMGKNWWDAINDE